MNPSVVPIADGHDAIFAVVVTMDRPTELERLLGVLSRQTRPLARIVVVDNGMLAETRDVVAACDLAQYTPSRRNLGGAGGFVLGIMQALALGAARVWIMDDDGMPASETCLATLAEAADFARYDMVSPLILDIDDPNQLAFYYYVRGRPVKRRNDLTAHATFPQFAHLFNGALLRADTFERFGLPRYELFFRGDETDFMYRLARDGAKFATICSAAFLHPSGARDTLPIMGGRFHAVIPASPFARYHYYRNRGTLFREYRLARAFIYDVIRYGWAFLITKRGDWRGLANWANAVRKGWTRRFGKMP